MSTQPQQPPIFVYPNTAISHSPSSHSNGSFGTVFIVLAVIVVVSGIACCLGRICNKRQNKQKPNKHNQQSHNFRPKDKSRERESDLEFGFEKRFPTVRSGPIRNGDPRGFKPSGLNGHHMNGNFKAERMNPVDMDEPRADANMML